MRIQGLDLAEPRIHLDLHVDDVALAAQTALGLGAEQVLDAGYRVMRSPGGFDFCLVPYDGEQQPSRVDQVCLDVPAPLFDAECDFWAELIGLSLEPSVLGEFVSLEHRQDLPLRVLLQRLGAEDHRGQVHGHFDVSAGNVRTEVAADHVELGAEMVREHQWWSVMRDPVGQTYCVTRRDPHPKAG